MGHEHGQEHHGRHSWPPPWPDISDQAVIAALEAVPRHLFVPLEHRGQAYSDVPLPIGEDQTISQPYIVALMTQALRVTPHSRVLEIGTGSGYQAAVLAQITPYVYSVEARPGLGAAARNRLRALGCPVEVRIGDGCAGWPEHAPYDCVIVTAAAPEIPPALLDQLAHRGRMVIPIGRSAWNQVLWLLKRAPGRLQLRRLAEVRFVPLMGRLSPDPGEDAAAAARRLRLLQRTQTP
jgi:protein-L-isoaspartate(D-aspartate) O-methyltransferase